MFKPRLFTKYMLTYTALFFIPVLILAFHAFNIFNNVLNKEIISNTSSLLEQAKNSIDSRVEELNNLSIQISNNPYLSSSSISGDFMNVVQAVKLLNNFSIPNNFFDNFFIYYFDHDLLYSPKGTVNEHFFSNSLYHYDNWSLEELQRQLLSDPTVFVKQVSRIDAEQSVQKNILYAVPLPFMSEKPTGALFFLIREQTIYDILKETLHANKSSVLILDGKKQPITSMGELSFESLDVNALINSGELNSEQRTMAGKTYFVSSKTSSRTGWTYISFLPAQAVTSKMSGLQMSTLALFLGLFIVGVLLIYIFMRVNYKPLGELTSQAVKLLGKEASGRGGIDSVKTAVHQMSSKISLLEAKYHSTSPIMRQQLLLRLLKGEFTDPEEFAVAGEEYGLAVSGQQYAVANILLDSFQESFTAADAVTVLQEVFTDRYRVFVLDNVLEKHIILILSDEGERSFLCEELCSHAVGRLAHSGLTCTIGLGNWFASLSDISESYLQACSALDYRLIKGKGTVIAYQEIETNQNHVGYSVKRQLELLDKYIADHNPELFTQVLDTIFKQLKEKQIPLMSAKLLCYDVIQTIVQAIYRNNYYLNADLDSKVDIISLSQYDTVEELSARIKNLCSDIFFTVTGKEQPTNKQMEKIKDYICEHCWDSNFSLQGLSDHVNMSVSYLSHYFKAQENRNISDYVTELRMTKAQALLADSSYNLQQVAQSVGYVNQSSFIRKFKQITGVTPGSYRDAIQDKKST
ncbi:helix-turn-helix domain-containing protein [Paenibacillus silviterrae]|uniref:helix-turn-helix domain-containing protein n=1 Tax=Paenibacillus silviterrae TaxID=3242194 RepID=UPI0025438203|nr:helix-turn-helix domain-containing protein [Paenibacillus chinjuensis]